MRKVIFFNYISGKIKVFKTFNTSNNNKKLVKILLFGFKLALLIKLKSYINCSEAVSVYEISTVYLCRLLFNASALRTLFLVIQISYMFL